MKPENKGWNLHEGRYNIKWFEEGQVSPEIYDTLGQSEADLVDQSQFGEDGDDDSSSLRSDDSDSEDMS